MLKKSFFILVAVIILYTIGGFAQSTATTKPMSFSITKEVKPPILELVEEPYFIDADGNSAVDANEKCKIVMKVRNKGMGDGIGLKAQITATGTTNGISVSSHNIENIKVDSTATVEFPIITNMNTADGFVNFDVFIDEPLGFISQKYTLRVQTRKFQEPKIIVKDYVVSGDNGGNLEKQKRFYLKVLMQNVQQGLGEDVNVRLIYPENVLNISGQDLFTYSEWLAGETKTLDFQLIANGKYEGTSLPLKVVITEKYGKYAEDKEIKLTLNQPLVASRTIEVESQISQTNIVDAQLRSDVDRNIPQTGLKKAHRYAIIIGNQDYHSWQSGLVVEQDVLYATEDAGVFKQYCQNTLGLEEQNIVLLNNATAAQMNQTIYLITRLVDKDNQWGNQPEIIFYYAGHGLPDENTKEPYLIPVDVNASNLSNAISLYELYEKLTATGAKRVTVFLDACFSGGGREAGLIASRGIRVTPKKDVLSGNIVIFSATSADQTALPYKEKQHGMFTYFLLKKLQESKGNCSYSEMYEYLNKNVGDNSLRVNRKEQNPEVNTSAQVQDKWRTWTFN